MRRLSPGPAAATCPRARPPTSSTARARVGRGVSGRTRSRRRSRPRERSAASLWRSHLLRLAVARDLHVAALLILAAELGGGGDAALRGALRPRAQHRQRGARRRRRAARGTHARHARHGHNQTRDGRCHDAGRRGGRMLKCTGRDMATSFQRSPSSISTAMWPSTIGSARCDAADSSLEDDEASQRALPQGVILLPAAAPPAPAASTAVAQLAHASLAEDDSFFVFLPALVANVSAMRVLGKLELEELVSAHKLRRIPPEMVQALRDVLLAGGAARGLARLATLCSDSRARCAASPLRTAPDHDVSPRRDHIVRCIIAYLSSIPAYDMREVRCRCSSECLRGAFLTHADSSDVARTVRSSHARAASAGELAASAGRRRAERGRRGVTPPGRQVVGPLPAAT